MTACVVLNHQQEFDLGGVRATSTNNNNSTTHNTHSSSSEPPRSFPSPSPPVPSRDQKNGNKRFSPFKLIIPVVARGGSGPLADADVMVHDGGAAARAGASPSPAGAGGAGGAAAAAAAGAAGTAGAAGAGAVAAAANDAGEARDGLAPLPVRTKSILKRSGSDGGALGGAASSGNGSVTGAAPPSLRSVSWNEEALEAIREFERSESVDESEDSEEEAPKPAAMCCVIS